MKRIVIALAFLLCTLVVVYPFFHRYGDNVYAKVMFRETQVIQVNDDTFRCPKDESHIFVQYMCKNGWTVADQLGSCYIFEKNGERREFILSFKTLYAQWTRI